MCQRIKILIVDDHPFFRKGVRFFLESVSDIEVIGESENGHQALQAAQGLQLDLVLLDIQMPGMDGIETTRALRAINPDIQVLILTSFGQEEKIMSAIASGASGYCLKNAPPAELIAAIHAVAAGGTYLGKGITSGLLALPLEQFNTDEQFPESNFSLLTQINNIQRNPLLTRRESDVIEKIAAGLSNREIAVELFVSEKTVKTHVANIFQKLDVKTRTQAALKYFKHKRMDVSLDD